MAEKQAIVVFIDESLESKKARQYIQKNLESLYDMRYCPASGPFTPSASFEGDGTLYFGQMLWHFLSDLKDIAKERRKK